MKHPALLLKANENKTVPQRPACSNAQDKTVLKVQWQQLNKQSSNFRHKDRDSGYKTWIF